ncbi:MAG: hypothetical protein WCT45_01690 [Candidatus Paceibacterota bacterium]|jgi:cell division septal protein FtsQ
MSVRVSSGEHSSARFLERRRKRRRRLLVASLFLLALVVGGCLYAVWRDSARISHVTIYGADQSLAELATAEMAGSYFGVVPRNSTFFFPAGSIRADIIAAHPDIAAVSIFRNGITGLSVRLDYRVPIARWCGLAPTEGVAAYCYLFDANGFIFSALPSEGGSAHSATTSPTVNNFALYAPLAGETLEPLRANIAHAEQLPAVFDLARELSTLGSPVENIVFRDDEVDLHTKSGTRVTYVLGNEQNAFTALVSAKGNVDLASGVLEYVDLRFDGKVYLKKRESAK